MKNESSVRWYSKARSFWVYSGWRWEDNKVRLQYIYKYRCSTIGMIKIILETTREPLQQCSIKYFVRKMQRFVGTR